MKHKNYEENDDKYEEEDCWSEMDPRRSSYETDDDYEDRMQSLYGDDWNMI